MEAVYGNEAKTLINMTVDEITSSVPKDIGNREYREIVAWVEAGNTIGDYVAPPQDE